MTVYKEEISIKSNGGRPTYVNLTFYIQKAIENSKVKSGICTVISPHTTCAVFFEEFVHDYNENGEEFLQEDLNNVLNQIIPDQTREGMYKYPGEKHYQAVASWPDAEEYLPGGDRAALWNCDAHLKATVVGSSQTFEVDDGRLGVGKTGYIYFADFDRTRPRTRTCKVIIMGE